MADKFFYRSGPVLLRPVPIGSGTVVDIGMLCKLSSGKLTKVLSAADNLSILVIAAQAHGATDGSGTINAYIPNPLSVFEYDLDAATDITFGDALQMNTAQKLKKSTTDRVAVAVE